MLPVIVHTLAFCAALFVQSIGSPLVGVWLCFFLAGCVILMREGEYPRHKTPIWYAALGWLLMIILSAFFLAPVQGGSTTMWMLLAMPALALCMRKEHLEGYTASFLTVSAVFSAGLIVQWAVGMKFTVFNYDGYAWPLADPNNAAVIVNAGLIVSLHKALKHPKWWPLLPIFIAALVATGSKAGGIAGALGCGLVIGAHIGLAASVAILPLLIGLTTAVVVLDSHIMATLVTSVDDRLPIWIKSADLLGLRPWGGLGLGSFFYWYEQVRTEFYTMGWHSHNDLLQFAIEMGIPSVLVFLSLVIACVVHGSVHPVASAVLGMIFLQSLVEFQFYIPSVSMVAGLALAHLDIAVHDKTKKTIKFTRFK